jgi:hypothetical protein
MPTEESFLRLLEDTLGPSEAQQIWQQACRAAGIDVAPRPLTVEQLAAAGAQLATLSGRVSVLGASMSVRIASARALARTRRASGSREVATPRASAPALGAVPAAMPDRTPPTGGVSPAAAAAREEDIAELRLVRGGLESELQPLVEQAAVELGLPYAVVSIVMRDAQQFIAVHGLRGWMAEARGTPIEWAFCSNAVERGAIFALGDTTRYPGADRNPVVQEEGVRSYIGAPLVSARGKALGTLCVMGTAPHEFSPGDRAHLRALAEEIVRRLERRVHPPHDTPQG